MFPARPWRESFPSSLAAKSGGISSALLSFTPSSAPLSRPPSLDAKNQNAHNANPRIPPRNALREITARMLAKVPTLRGDWITMY
jgi:hypothetical protein